jgi:hypothetical protein
MRYSISNDNEEDSQDTNVIFIIMITHHLMMSEWVRAQ